MQQEIMFGLTPLRNLQAAECASPQLKWLAPVPAENASPLIEVEAWMHHQGTKINPVYEKGASLLIQNSKICNLKERYLKHASYLMRCYVHLVYLPNDVFIKDVLLILLNWSLAIFCQVNLWRYCFYFCAKFLLNPIPAKKKTEQLKTSRYTR
jgi:hypothetical protein